MHALLWPHQVASFSWISAIAYEERWCHLRGCSWTTLWKTPFGVTCSAHHLLVVSLPNHVHWMGPWISPDSHKLKHYTVADYFAIRIFSLVRSLWTTCTMSSLSFNGKAFCLRDTINGRGAGKQSLKHSKHSASRKHVWQCVQMRSWVHVPVRIG